jgi:DNA-binding IscR family transcriptional regulator
MKVPSSIDRAARILIFLAGKGPRGTSTPEEIVKSQGISRPILLPLLARLKKAGLIRMRRIDGTEEILLKRSPDRIHLGMILHAVGDSADWRLTLSRTDDEGIEIGRPGLPAWKEVEKLMIEALEAYTLDHLAWDTLFYL